MKAIVSFTTHNRKHKDPKIVDIWLCGENPLHDIFSGHLTTIWYHMHDKIKLPKPPFESRNLLLVEYPQKVSSKDKKISNNATRNIISYDKLTSRNKFFLSVPFNQMRNSLSFDLAWTHKLRFSHPLECSNLVVVLGSYIFWSSYMSFNSFLNSINHCRELLKNFLIATSFSSCNFPYNENK